MPPQQPNQPGHHNIMDVQAPVPQPKPTPEPPQPDPHNLPTLPSQMTATPAKRRFPLVAIIIAVIVSASLIGIVVFVFISSKRATDNNSASQDTAGQTPVEGRLTGQDVNATKQEITKNLNNLDDSKDFTSDDLSNQTLGL